MEKCSAAQDGQQHPVHHRLHDHHDNDATRIDYLQMKSHMPPNPPPGTATVALPNNDVNRTER